MSSLWPKTMKWLEEENGNQVRWVRPIRNILCIFDSTVVDLKFAGCKSNDKSFGHLLLSPDSFKVTDFKQYNKKLSDNYVVLDQDLREKNIVSEIQSICKKLKCKTNNLEQF